MRCPIGSDYHFYGDNSNGSEGNRCQASRLSQSKTLSNSNSILLTSTFMFLCKVIELIDIARGAGVEVLGIIPEYFEEEN